MVYIGKTSYFMDICWKLHVKSYNNSCESKKSSKLYNFIRDNGGIHEFTYLILEEIPNISNLILTFYTIPISTSTMPSINLILPKILSSLSPIMILMLLNFIIKTIILKIDPELNAILPKKLLVTFVADPFKPLIFLTILPVLSVFA